MIINNEKLKIYCNTNYSIKGENKNIGDLSDSNLDNINYWLSRRLKLSKKQELQLKAVKFIINYRSLKRIERFEDDIKQNHINRAIKKATIITNWIEKSYKN